MVSIRRLKLAALSAGLLLATPVLAAETPFIWRDAETGCSYVGTSQSLTPRLRRDGQPDCPGVPSAKVRQRALSAALRVQRASLPVRAAWVGLPTERNMMW